MGGAHLGSDAARTHLWPNAALVSDRHRSPSIAIDRHRSRRAMGLPSTARAFFRYTERVEGNAMDAIDGNAVLLSMVIGGIGFVAFAYGKKQSRYPQMVAGLLLMGYPYFVSNVWAMLGIGAAIVAALFVVVKLGG